MRATAEQSALGCFRQRGGLLRTSQALKLGIHPRTLYHLRDAGRLDQVSRGVFRLADLPPMADPDLVAVAARVPRGVICLISALHFHGLTLEIPHEVSIALPPATKSPKLDHPPLRVFRFAGGCFTAGVDIHQMDGVAVKIYSPAKSVADAFRFRNRIGLDVAIHALRTVVTERRVKPAEIVRYARICRVERAMRPYMDSVL
ncbi:MAG: type IV toxin-antitoxin system AbiEi family antitoxin domain-containing protein [Acidobacteria bacterium]|nr:type IV toxin-antitoxin system AbiEi family antitoxin domain-containing protein [Acidobacteriota bacterium]